MYAPKAHCLKYTVPVAIFLSCFTVVSRYGVTYSADVKTVKTRQADIFG
jgi:hypothetical protein